MSCQIADQLIQKFRGARTRQPAAQPKTLAKFRALQVRGFSVTSALITFLQLVNPLDSFLCVLHASCSVFIKGISSWGTMGFAFQFVFVIFFFLNVLFNCQNLQHSEQMNSSCGLTEEGCEHDAKWNEESVRDSL